MLLSGGTGLLLAGIITYFFGDKIQADVLKAARMKRQAPILALIGAAMLAVRLSVIA